MARVHDAYNRPRSPAGAATVRPQRRLDAFQRDLRLFIDSAVRPDFPNVGLLSAGFAALTIVVALTLILRQGHVYNWEFRFMREIQSLNSPEWVSTLTAGSLTDPFSVIGASIVVLAVVTFCVCQRPVEAVLVLLMMALRFPAHFSKAIVERERPSGEVGLAGTGGDLSFASGHAEWLVTFYGFIVVLAVISTESYRLRVVVIATYAAFLATSTFSRLNGGYHWPLDIIGGWVIGAGLLALVFWLRRAALNVIAQRPARSSSE
jgi:membrane-associated phospholipid phosphatase